MSDKFQVVETYMRKDGLRIVISDEDNIKEVTLPAQFMDDIVERWEKIKNGKQSVSISRHYTNEWPKLAINWRNDKWT